jgi:actin-related protein
MEKLRLQQKENERLEEQLRKEREAQEKLRMEMEFKRQEEAKMKFLQLQQQKVEEEKRKREAQRKIEEQQRVELDKRQRELELKAQQVEKIKTPVSSPTPTKPTSPVSTTASPEVTDTFFGSLIETSKTIASNCKRLSTLIMEQYDIVIQEGSAGRSLMMDLIAVVDGTLTRMISMLNNNVMNIQDNLHDSIRLAASNLNGTVQALIGSVKNVSDVQKVGSISAEERTKQMRQHNIAVSYAIKNLVEELQKLKVAERADPHAAKLLSANSLAEAEEMSIAVTATQNAIDEVRIAQMPVSPPTPNQNWTPPVASPKRRLDSVARLNIMNAPPSGVKYTQEQIQKITKLQRRLKSWIVRRRMARTLELMRGSEEMKQTHHRFRVLSEIMETEASYMTSLEVCKKFFLDPLRAAVNTRPILSSEDIKTIFSSVEMILGFTTQVKSHLEARMKQWPAVQKLGDIFKDLAPAMKIYADYVNKFDAAMEVYKECIQNKAVADFLRDCMTRANTRLDLPSFLIMPVQRMPRYQLLLKELLKFTPESHVDHQNLKEAADAVTEVNVYINRKKQEQDNRLKIVALQEMIKSAVPLLLVAPHRLFVRQGPLLVKRNNEPSSTACVVFMFTDLLIVTTQSKTSDKSLSFNYVDKLNFAKCDFADLGNTDFKITEEKKVIAFTSSSPEEQRGWVKELKETIETVKLHSQLDGDISDTNNFKEGFVLLSATYGQLHKPRHCIDVTTALQNIIKEQGGASLTLNADTKSKLPGFSDPSKSKIMPGSSTRKKNSLMIVFSANGQVRTRTFGDADPVNLDANTP